MFINLIDIVGLIIMLIWNKPMSYPRVLKHASTILFVWVMASMVWATWFHIFHTSLCLSLGILKKKKKNYLRNILCSELNILLYISFLNSMKTYILLVIRSYFYFYFCLSNLRLGEGMKCDYHHVCLWYTIGHIIFFLENENVVKMECFFKIKYE